METPDTPVVAIVPDAVPGKFESLKATFRAWRTPILMGAAAVTGIVLYARATAESDDEVLEINEVTETP